MEEVHSLLRDPCGHVGGHDVANVFRNDAKPIQNGQSHHRAVHLTFQLNLALVPPCASLFRPPDLPRRYQGAGNGEEGRQTKIAAKVPPEPCPVVSESQDVDGVGQRGGYLHHAPLPAVLGVLLRQLAQHHLRQGQQQRAHPDDGQLGRRRGAVFDHLVIHLHVGGGTKPVDAEGAQRERGDSERGYLGRRKGKAS